MTTKEEVEKIVTFWEEGAGDAKNRHVVLHQHTHTARTRAPGLALQMPWGSCPLDVQSRGLAWPLPHHLVCVERIRFPSVALRLVLYNCTSGYPVPFEDVCLLELRELYDKYHARVKAIGFSGHHLGIAVDVAAYAMGAQWNERHFTKDRTGKGTDHAASLEPAGLT